MPGKAAPFIILTSHHYGVLCKGNMEKRKPTYDLESFKRVFSNKDKLALTGSALRSAAALGAGRSEIVEIIQTMRAKHFHKSMTSYADRRVWQDVYHVPSEIGTLYIKFTADAITAFRLLSFKEKDNV
jgi:motility quorum-sensing regulator / GCU-specific mRNA interferase toxin